MDTNKKREKEQKKGEKNNKTQHPTPPPLCTCTQKYIIVRGGGVFDPHFLDPFWTPPKHPQKGSFPSFFKIFLGYPHKSTTPKHKNKLFKQKPLV